MASTGEIVVEIHHIYVMVFAVTSVLALAVAWLAWRQRAEFKAVALTALMLGVAAWCGAEAFLWWAPTLAEQKFWLAMTYPGVLVTVMALLVFAFDIAGMEEWLTPRRIALVSLAPAVFCIIAMTNPGELFYTSYVAVTIGHHVYYAAQGGPLFWAYLAVTYAVPVTAFILIGRTYLRSSGAKRVQCGTVLAGSVLPFIVSVANQLSPNQLEGLEATAFFFTGSIFLLALTRGRLLDANELLTGRLEEVNLLADAMYGLATGDTPATACSGAGMQERLVREVSRSQRTGLPFALLALGIDGFERIRNSFSPAAGEAALALVGAGLLGGSRAIDVVCHRDGDEFLIVMPEADAENAYQRAEELRTHIDGLSLQFEGHDIPISASIGVAAFPLHGDTSEEAVSAAVRALVLARQSGGDRTVIA